MPVDKKKAEYFRQYYLKNKKRIHANRNKLRKKQREEAQWELPSDLQP